MCQSTFTRLHGGDPGCGKATCRRFASYATQVPRSSSYSVYREGYGGTSTRLYEGGTRACYQTVRRLSSSLYNQTPMTTTTTTTTAAAAAATIFKYYHHSLITLSHPLRLRPLLLQTHTTRSSFLSQPTEHTFPPTREISLLHIHTVGNTAFFFQISRHFFQTYRREGKLVTWPGKWTGVTLFLRKSSPPLI